MKTLPSVELLSEVLGIEATKIHHDKANREIDYFDDVKMLGSLNIYELAHKCKEWAVEQGYHINSKCYEIGGLACITDNQGGMEILGCMETFHANTEPEAIFKACEWILENKDKA